MAKKEGSIEVRVERAGSDGSPAQKISVDISDGHSIEVACRDGIVVIRLCVAELGVCLTADGPQSDLARAINLLRLHLPRCLI